MNTLISNSRNCCKMWSCYYATWSPGFSTWPPVIPWKPDAYNWRGVHVVLTRQQAYAGLPV